MLCKPCSVIWPLYCVLYKPGKIHRITDDEGGTSSVVSRVVLSYMAYIRSPLERIRVWDKLGNQVHIIMLQRSDIKLCVALRIQVKPLKPLQPRQQLAVMVVQQVLIRPVLVKSVERMVSDDKQRCGGKAVPIVLQHAVQVLVVSKRHVDISQAAAGGVHAMRRVVATVVRVGVGRKQVWVHNPVVMRAAHRKRVTHDRPLGL